MGLLGMFRRYQSRAPSLVAVLVAVAWLGLAAAPCQAVADMLHADSTHQGTMPAGNCGHCLPATSDPGQDCATMNAPDCLSQGQLMVEHREADKLRPAAMPPPVLADFSAFGPAIDLRTNIRIGPAPVSSVSVQQRYCTYLK
jgi:hypothetical protein